MVRTVISLNEEDKAWLDRRARVEGVTMTEIVRRSIRLYREATDPSQSGFPHILEETRGTWPGADGLDYQRRLRDDWEPGA